MHGKGNNRIRYDCRGRTKGNTSGNAPSLNKNSCMTIWICLMRHRTKHTVQTAARWARNDQNSVTFEDVATGQSPVQNYHQKSSSQNPLHSQNKTFQSQCHDNDEHGTSEGEDGVRTVTVVWIAAIGDLSSDRSAGNDRTCGTASVVPSIVRDSFLQKEKQRAILLVDCWLRVFLWSASVILAAPSAWGRQTANTSVWMRFLSPVLCKLLSWRSASQDICCAFREEAQFIFWG